ncbi:MAG: hypothetical protein ACR2KD_01040 [Thermoleophilaceae bacterium]
MNIFGLSDHHRAFRRTGQCPNGHFLIGTLRLTDPSGNSVSILTPYPLMDRGTMAQCPQCGVNWAVFGDFEPPPPAAGQWRLLDVVETDRYEEPIGNDSRVLDSSRTSAQITRSLSFRQEWVQTVDVEGEKTQSTSGGVSLSMADIVSLEASTDQAIKSRYGVSTELRHVEEEQMAIPVPVGKRLRVTLQWKRVWQAGYARVAAPDGTELNVPFSLVVGLTFDQAISDEPS